MYNTHTHNRSATNLTKHKKNVCLFFKHYYQLILFLFSSLYFYSFVNVNSTFSSSFSLFVCVCVCVGCNHYFSLAVCSFSSFFKCSFFCLFMCCRHRMSHVENKKRKTKLTYITEKRNTNFSFTRQNIQSQLVLRK